MIIVSFFFTVLTSFYEENETLDTVEKGNENSQDAEYVWERVHYNTWNKNKFIKHSSYKKKKLPHDNVENL